MANLRVTALLRRWLRVNIFHGKGYRFVARFAKKDGSDPLLAGLVFTALMWLRRKDQQLLCQERLVRKIARALATTCPRKRLVMVSVPSLKRQRCPEFELEKHVLGVERLVKPIVAKSKIPLVDQQSWTCEYGFTKKPRFGLAKLRKPVPCSRIIVAGRILCFVSETETRYC